MPRNAADSFVMSPAREAESRLSIKPQVGNEAARVGVGIIIFGIGNIWIGARRGRFGLLGVKGRVRRDPPRRPSPGPCADAGGTGMVLVEGGAVRSG